MVIQQKKEKKENCVFSTLKMSFIREWGGGLNCKNVCHSIHVYMYV